MKDGEKIRLLYEFTLNRAADVDGYNHYVTLLRGGASLSDLARTMINSDEFRVSRGVVDDVPFVYSLYLNGLDRRGSIEEVGAWVDYLREGHDMGDVIAGFVLSAEAATTIGQPEPYREG